MPVLKPSAMAEADALGVAVAEMSEMRSTNSGGVGTVSGLLNRHASEIDRQRRELETLQQETQVKTGTLNLKNSLLPVRPH
jgi:hypothetical protein